MSTIHITIGTSQNGKACGTGDYEVGSQATIVATPNTNCIFISWNDGVTLNPRTVEATDNTTYTAQFNNVTPLGNVIRYNSTSALSNTWITNNTDTARNTYDSQTGNGVLYLNSGVTSIGGNVGASYSPFYAKSNLVSVDLTDSGLTAIGKQAFVGCTSLTSVLIGSTTTSINANRLFEQCPSLASISVASGNIFYNDGNGSNCVINSSTNTLVVGCKNTVIPNTVTRIGNYAFEFCTGLTSITIPNSVTAIGDSAFSCSGLTSVTIPNSVITIEDNAFLQCTDLASVTIGNGVTSIGEWAFSGCTSLTTATIGSGVTSISNYAFHNYYTLTTVTCYATTPPTLGTGNFDASNDTLKVPSASLVAYRVDSSWSSAFTTITII